MVRRDAHILEDVGADEEGVVAGIGAEARTAGDVRRGSERLEGRAQVDGRLGDGRTAERSQQQLDMLALFNGRLNRIGRNRDGGEGDMAAARDGARRFPRFLRARSAERLLP